MAAAPLTQGQSQFVSRLSANTGLNPGVVTSWVLAEESGGAAQQRQASNNHDWLNVGYTDSGQRGTGNSVWSNPIHAADATSNWLKGSWNDPGFGKASSGIQGIVGTARMSPQAQIQAIQRSGWASSGYPALGQLFSQYGAGAPNARLAGAAQSKMPKAPSTGTTTTTTTAPKTTTTTSGGQPDVNAAGIAALMSAANKPINTSGKVSGGNLLSSFASNVASGAYTTPVVKTTSTTAGIATQRTSQAVAGKAVNDAVAGGANADSQKLLKMIASVSGAPYSQANHNAIGEKSGQIKAQGTDCSGLISWLMGPQGLGLWSASQTTPTIPGAPGLQKGAGSTITVYNNAQAGNAGHVFIKIGNAFFASEGGVGVHELPASEAQAYLTSGSAGGTYQAFHPKGL